MKKTLIYFLVCLAHTSQGQSIDEGLGKFKTAYKNIKTLVKDPKSAVRGKGLKITGGVSANHVFYHGIGIEQRRRPFNYFYNGNIGIDIAGKFQMPITFAYSNGNLVSRAAFNNNLRLAQPFNRFVLKPAYKSFVGQIGTCALNFSPYTLASHRYEGIGFDFKSPKMPLYLSFMKGNLFRAVYKDSIGQNTPSYLRAGLGVKLGYQKSGNMAELILFKAQDEIGSLPYNLDDRNILPQANVATALKLKNKLGLAWALNTEIAISGLTRDIRGSESRANGFKTFGGLLAYNASTRFYKALQTAIDYQANAYKTGLSYSRVDANYKTLGGYMFNNDLETFSGNFQTQFLQDKLTMQLSMGLQQDNLDGNKPLTTQRWVGSSNVGFTPTEKLNLSVSYSNFSNFSNMRSSFDYLSTISPYNTLDTLNYQQIDENIVSNLLWVLPNSTKEQSKSINASINYQSGKQSQGSQMAKNVLLNGVFGFIYQDKKKKTMFSPSINSSYMEQARTKTWILGPSLQGSTSYLSEQLQIKLGGSYNYSRSNGKVGAKIANVQAGASYQIQKKHNLNLQMIYFNRVGAVGERNPQASFSEITATLGYTYNFTLVDLKIK